MSTVHFVVPGDIDDPARPSGGNTYDRRVSRELAALGWAVNEHAVPDAALARALQRIPDGAVVLVDGLLASPAPEVLLPEADRFRQVVLVHMPLGTTGEGRVLNAAAAVVTTSSWTRHRLIELHGLPAGRVHVAEPGVDAARLAPSSAAGGSLLCVAALTPGKGHEVLLDALAMTSDLAWRCECVGSVVRDPSHADHVRGRARAAGLAERVGFAGPLTGEALDRAYATADLLVLPSHAETYGMVVTEALARGVPVVASDVGGVTESLGRGANGTRPGLSVPPGDPAALASALRRWLEDAGLRDRLRRAARERREQLRPWSATASAIDDALARVAPSAGDGSRLAGGVR